MYIIQKEAVVMVNKITLQYRMYKKCIFTTFAVDCTAPTLNITLYHIVKYKSKPLKLPQLDLSLPLNRKQIFC